MFLYKFMDEKIGIDYFTKKKKQTSIDRLWGIED